MIFFIYVIKCLPNLFKVQTIQLIKMLITSEMIDDSSTITSIVETLMEVIGSSVLQSNSKYDVIGKLKMYIIYFILKCLLT